MPRIPPIRCGSKRAWIATVIEINSCHSASIWSSSQVILQTSKVNHYSNHFLFSIFFFSFTFFLFLFFFIFWCYLLQYKFFVHPLWFLLQATFKEFRLAYQSIEWTLRKTRFCLCFSPIGMRFSISCEP